MIDMVVPRLEMKETIARICGILMKREVELPKLEEPAAEEADEAATEEPVEETASEDKDAKEAEPAS
jgi:acetyl-CoA carboxylase carboxyl transferase subunit beta